MHDPVFVSDAPLRRRARWCVLIIGALLWAMPVRADQARDPYYGTPVVEEPPPPLLRRYAPEIDERMKALPPFLRDTAVNLHLRTFYFNRENSNDTYNEAWAGGGWLEYRSGWLLDTFRIGAIFYTSQPLYAPEDRDGTLLLAPGQEPINTLGQAYAQLRYQDYALLTGYRQSVNQGYVNPYDSRMVPNTFEGVSLTGTLGPVAYYLGYLTAIKTRGSNDFVNMAEVAGVADENRGLALGSVKFAPINGLDVYVANYVTPDVYNTAYANAEYKHDFTDQVGGGFGIQLTDQRSVGSDLLGSFKTWNVGARAQLNWRGLSFIAAMSATGDEAALSTPYGAWPGYLNLIEFDFDRANEKAWGVGISSNWGDRRFPGVKLPGLSLLLFYAEGYDANDPSTGAPLPNRREGDLDIMWRVPLAKGLRFRFRNAYADAGVGSLIKEFRIIIDYELPIL
jgi:hypothetical protein